MAIINVSPATDITALITSDSVSEGDVLLLEDGEYFQSVFVLKNYLRIVAKGNNVVFNGKSTLISGIVLIDVIGVEINGISIMNYRGNGILLEVSHGNRIVRNKINNVLNNGIYLFSSHENLIWQNEICNAHDGVFLISGSTNNRVMENFVNKCFEDGFETFEEDDSNNVFISNTAIDNGGYGLHIYGRNNLLHKNLLINNITGGINTNNSRNTIATGNIIKNSKNRGAIIQEDINLFFGENLVESNRNQGIAVLRGNNGIYYNNLLRYNTDSGMILSPVTNSNFAHQNKLKCNIPAGIINSGTNNILFNNLEEPCKPCELTFEDCRFGYGK